MPYKNLNEYINKLVDAVKSVDNNCLNTLSNQIESRLNGEGDIYLLGNGGSAANAHHIAGDYLKTFSLNGNRIKIDSLSDNECYLTAAANDIDFSEIYEVLVNTRITKNDLMIFLSGSGNSMNLIKAARKAKKCGIKTAALVGYKCGALNDLVDIPLHFLIEDMEIAEDCQISTFHFIKQNLLFKNTSSDISNSFKYEKRTNEDLIA